MNWLWGPYTAAYHFGTRAAGYLLDDDVDQMLKQLVKFVPSPPLFQRNTDPAHDISLPVRKDLPEPFMTMSRRRTNRLLEDRPIDIAELADCLQFSMAITATIKDPEIVDLPLKMTPSGGGRNPFEAFVCVRNVKGLAPGTYHYSALQKSLGLVRADPPPEFPKLMGGQRWTRNGAAIIFLVANFERPMWKYHDPAAYRVTAIEAGHIAQNIMLVATHHGLVANATGAMTLDLIDETLKVGGVTQSVLYGLVLGTPGKRPTAPES
jgi:SagB-type dehydrogenase family enzyme